MGGIVRGSERVSPHDSLAASRQAQLSEIVGTLEQALKTLESLGLTLAVALLDHANAEVKRHLAP
jgi:hypothetical protein